MTPQRCESCLKQITGHREGSPLVCGDCWEKLTPAERIAHMDRLAMNKTAQQLADDGAGFMSKVKQILENDGRFERFSGRN
jgi:hypothetical protein